MAIKFINMNEQAQQYVGLKYQILLREVFNKWPFPRKTKSRNMMIDIYIFKVQIRKTFPAYNYAESSSCYKDLFCAKQKKCNGRIFDCQFFNADAVSFKLFVSLALIIGWAFQASMQWVICRERILPLNTFNAEMVCGVNRQIYQN